MHMYEGRLISNAHSEKSRKRDHVFNPLAYTDVLETAGLARSINP